MCGAIFSDQGRIGGSSYRYAAFGGAERFSSEGPCASYSHGAIDLQSPNEAQTQADWVIFLHIEYAHRTSL